MMFRQSSHTAELSGVLGLSRFRNILVDCDKDARSQPAFEAASVLAHACGARLGLIDTAGLARGAQPLRLTRDLRFGSGVPHYRCTPPSPPHQVLVREVALGGYDLLVRRQQPNRARQDETNRLLFRDCGCPVWAVGVRPILHRPRIVAAVDALSVDQQGTALCESVLRLAAALARLLEGEAIALD